MRKRGWRDAYRTGTIRTRILWSSSGSYSLRPRCRACFASFSVRYTNASYRPRGNTSIFSPTEVISVT